MNIIIENDITVDEYRMLRDTTDWTKLSNEQIENLLKNSAFKVRAKADGKTVGIGRVLFDFGYQAFISDIIVEPDYQGCGIGRKIVETLMEVTKQNAFANEYLQFNLLSAPGKAGFYEKMGFIKRTESNGFGMCLRLNADK